MNKQDMMKMQTYVLKVNIHCDGCKDKVKKLIQKIDGVYNTSIDAEQGKVMVTGTVDPARLIKKLKNSGKHAELWGGQRGNFNCQNQNFPANQFNNFKMGNGKMGKDNKPQQMQLRGQVKDAQFSQTKGANDFKMPHKVQKSVKFNLQDVEVDGSDEEFDGSDDYGEYDEDFDEDDDAEDDEFGHGHGNGHHNGDNKMMPFMGSGYGPKGPTSGMINRQHHIPMNGVKGGRDVSVNFKKGGAIDLPTKAKGNIGQQMKNGINKVCEDSEGWGGNNKKGAKGKGGGGSTKKKDAKSGGGGLLGFLGFGKKSKNGGQAGSKKNSTRSSRRPSVCGAGNHKIKEDKRGCSKFDEFQDIDIISHKPTEAVGARKGGNGKGGNFGNGGGGKFGQVGTVGQMGGGMIPLGQMGPMRNYPVVQMGQMGQVRDFSSVEGLPAHATMNNGYNNYQGQAMQAPPSSYQQYMNMPMMMNQQQQQQQQAMNMGNGVYQPMMYARQHAPMNYMTPQPMPSHPMNDPMTHIFSDENTENCSIM